MSSSQLERLEVLLQSKATSHEPEFKVALSRLSAELKHRLGDGSPSSLAFFSGAVRALSRIRGTAHVQVRMACLFDSGLFLLTNGYGSEALHASRELDELATRSGVKAWMRKAGNFSGMVNADLGNVAGAVVRYAEALSLAKEIRDLSGEVSVFINLGCALIYGGLYREAIPCLERGLELSRTDAVAMACTATHFSAGAAEFERAALTNLAQCHLYLEELDKAFARISECLAKSTEPTDAPTANSRSIREFTMVNIALELGLIELAREHSKRCTTYARRAGNRGQHTAEITRGLCEVYGGNPTEGLRILDALLDSSYNPNTGREATLKALVKAYDQVGDAERALDYLTQLLGLIRSTREQGICALLSLPQAAALQANFAAESEDLRALRYKEAQLRAKVAENHAVSTQIDMLERLAVAADLKEESSGEHGFRVGRLSSLLAEELHWSRDGCFAIEIAARLHDIGKVAVPDRILLNSTELKDAERHFIGTHTTIGAELLAKRNVPQLRMAEEIARHHHEWWNGAGYPSKLAGKRIPIHARIVALADVFDALTHGRPFAQPWPIDKAIDEIQCRRSTQFDPDLTDRFLKLIARLRSKHANLDTYLAKAGQDSPFLQARNKIRQMLDAERKHEHEHEIDAVVGGNETRH